MQAEKPLLIARKTRPTCLGMGAPILLALAAVGATCAVVVGLAVLGPLRDMTNRLSMLTGPAGMTLELTAPASGGPVLGTLAGVPLQHDAWAQILRQFKTARNCSDVVNTHISVAQEPDGSGAWEEVWAVEACGTSNQVAVHFTPDSANGGTYIHSTITDTASQVSGPVKGGLGKDFVRYHVWSAIGYAFMRGYGCTIITSQGIEVSKAPDDNGAWHEAWTVEACGTQQVVEAKLVPHPLAADIDYVLELKTFP